MDEVLCLVKGSVLLTAKKKTDGVICHCFAKISAWRESLADGPAHGWSYQSIGWNVMFHAAVVKKGQERELFRPFDNTRRRFWVDLPT